MAAAVCVDSLCVATQDMGVDAVLQSNTPVEQGGVLTRTRRGQLCYDMAALTQELKQRYASRVICMYMCVRASVRVCVCVCVYMYFASHESIFPKSEHILQ